MSTNINIAECLVQAKHLGFTRVHNVCADTFYDVPWGAGEWFGACVVGGVTGVGLVFLAGLGWLLWRGP